MYQGQSENLRPGEEKACHKFAGVVKTSGKLTEWFRHQQKNLNTLGLSSKKG